MVPNYRLRCGPVHRDNGVVNSAVPYRLAIREGVLGWFDMKAICESNHLKTRPVVKTFGWLEIFHDPFGRHNYCNEGPDPSPGRVPVLAIPHYAVLLRAYTAGAPALRSIE